MTIPGSEVRIRRPLNTSTRSGTSPDTVAPEWVVCHRATRPVAEGVVDCPQGSLVPWACCLSCRHLEVAEGDRDPERCCSTEAD